MPLNRPSTSLRTELLLSIGILAGAAMVLGVAAVVVLYGVLDPEYAAVYVGVLIGVDLAVVVTFVAYQVNRIVVRPLGAAAEAAEAISGGNLTRRLPSADTVELANLSESVNRMTDRLIEDRTHMVRVEKMASIGRLAAGIAHEIGNPLGAITGYADVLRSETSPRAQESVAGVAREAERIDRIIRGLLDYARPSARASGRIDVNDVAKSVVELVMSQGVLKHADFRFSPAADAVHVLADRHDLEQMLVNLLLNANDAIGGRGSLALVVRSAPRLNIVAGARRASDLPDRPPSLPGPRALRWLKESEADEVAMIAVIDSGPGIPEQDAERVFEPFYTTKDPGKGTGLGLAIVARAVENAGGAIWVSRSREGGAAFRVYLPARP